MRYFVMIMFLVFQSVYVIKNVSYKYYSTLSELFLWHTATSLMRRINKFVSLIRSLTVIEKYRNEILPATFSADFPNQIS
jgi:hypothetical protein